MAAAMTSDLQMIPRPIRSKLPRDAEMVKLSRNRPEFRP